MRCLRSGRVSFGWCGIGTPLYFDHLRSQTSDIKPLAAEMHCQCLRHLSAVVQWKPDHRSRHADERVSLCQCRRTSQLAFCEINQSAQDFHFCAVLSITQLPCLSCGKKGGGVSGRRLKLHSRGLQDKVNNV